MKNLPPLPSEVPYGSLLIYSPRGSSEISLKSREVCYGIKNDRPPLIQQAVAVLVRNLAGELAEFFGADRILVPVPRSAPMREGALWPGLRICEEIHRAGIAHSVWPGLTRTEPVTKSATAGWGERPGPERHAETLDCVGDVLPHQFTLVDDVLTRGATIVAAAAVLRAAFPNATIRAFAMVRTMGLVPEVDAVVQPQVGVVRYSGGRLEREP